MRRLASLLVPAALIVLPPSRVPAAEDVAAVDPRQIQQLIDQNRRLQQQVDALQKTVENLEARMAQAGKSSATQEQEIESLQSQGAAAAAPEAAVEAKPSESGGGTVRVSGEFGFVYFKSGPDGPYSTGEFRPDDAKLFVDASVWKNVYLHSELDLVTRETSDSNFHLGEVYAEVENALGHWGADDLVNLRVGRFYEPFGEEYQNRGVMENPLISHSVSDIWGMDSGVESYGRIGAVSYAAAVQDGGINTLQNFHSGKAVTGRVAVDPLAWLHVSASAMTTSELSAAQDKLSAIWFGNAFFRALGPAATTPGFQTDLYEADAAVRWRAGHLSGALGQARFTDSNSAANANDSRQLNYFYVEGVQQLVDKLYGALRYSGVRVAGGYPLAGQGIVGEYAFGNILTTDLYRFSFGLGYQFSPPVVLKIEYSPEWGQTTTGAQRDGEDLFSTEFGIKF